MDPQVPSKQNPILISLGEALFDCFPDRAILGGAPLNLVVHAQQLLSSWGRGVLISRVGDDDLGRHVIRQVADRGVQTAYIQIDNQRPTGTVQVRLSPTGEPSYEILENVAWDNIQFDTALNKLCSECSCICFGTLAQRSVTNRETFHRCLSAAPQAIRVLDVNLRQHYITPKVLENSLQAADVAKLNDDELARIAELLPDCLRNVATIDDRVSALRHKFELRIVALTRGPQGTVLYSDEGRFELEPMSMPSAANADGVGAGDACCAGLVIGLLKDWPLDRTLDLANRMGAFVASQPGGTPTLPQTLVDLAV
jgi:fructokinase